MTPKRGGKFSISASRRVQNIKPLTYSLPSSSKSINLNTSVILRFFNIGSLLNHLLSL